MSRIRGSQKCKFDLKPLAFQQSNDNLDQGITFAIEVEGGIGKNAVMNYNVVRRI